MIYFEEFMFIILILVFIFICAKIYSIETYFFNEYSKMSTGEASTKYNLVKLTSQHDVDLKRIRNLDYNNLKLVIFNKYYEIHPNELNTTLDLLDENEHVNKKGIPFRINKNYSMSSSNQDVDNVINTLSQSSIDTLCNMILYVSASPYTDSNDSFQNTQYTSYEATRIFGKIPSLKWKKINNKLEICEISLRISGLTQTERMYNNPMFVNKQVKIELVQIRNKGLKCNIINKNI